jgi:putative FmdB family regulatory protein
MPTYGYRCGTCGHEFEIRQRITEEPLVTCPKCGGKLAKMLYPAGVIF